jgi:hypothetical protein
MGNRQALWYEGKSCLGMLFLGGVVWLGLALGFPWKSVEAHRASQDESEQKLLRRIDGLAESLTRMAPEKTYEGYQAIPLELRREVYVRLTPEAKAAIWRGHYRYCLDSLPLNPQQRDCINKAIEMTSPALYQPSADTGEFADTVEGYRPYFEPSQFAFIFYGEEPLVGGQGRGVFSLRTDPRLRWAAGCNCRTYVGRAGNCGGMSKCDTGPCSLYPSCGPGGTQVCDGLCDIN